MLDPVPELIAPGQESVWDYPRPPAVRAIDERIVVVLGGIEICETVRSLQVLERSHPPTYYLPRSAFRPGALQPTSGGSWCEWKGRASYLDLVGGTTVARRAGWYYANPLQGYTALLDHVGVYPGLVDVCTVDGERVVPQPGDFYGGWITSSVAGPFKGGPGSEGW